MQKLVVVPWCQRDVLRGPAVSLTFLSFFCSPPSEYTYSVSATTIVNGQRRTAKAPTVTVRVTGEGMSASLSE